MKLPIPFSNPKTYAGHSGVDYGQPKGTRIPASGPGRITTRSHNASGGYYVWVQYDSGPLVGYHHMESHRGTPAPNSRVIEGSTLGYVGSTGNSTGPHLHSEVSGHRTTAGYWLFFDRNRVVGSAPAGGGGTPITPTEPKKRKKSMATVYRRGTSTNANFALGGDSPNTRANWITTRNADLWQGWVNVHGPYITLSEADFDLFGSIYTTSTVPTGEVTVGDIKVDANIDYEALAEAIAKKLPKGFSGTLS